MGWTRDESDLIWETTLTAAVPTSDPLPVMYLRAATVQVDGVFGGGVVTLWMGNRAGEPIPVETLRHAEFLPLTPMLPVRWFHAGVEDATEDTAVIVTVVGSR